MVSSRRRRASRSERGSSAKSVAGETVVVSGGHLRPQCLERLGECRGDRVGDEYVPTGPDLSRGAEHAGNQCLDRFRVIGRTRLAQQPRQAAPVGGRSIHRHRLLLIPRPA